MQNFKKRGQGAYIFIGVLLLIVFALSTYYYSSKIGGKATAEEIKVLEESIIPALKVYMKECIDNSAVDVVKKTASQGGELDPELYTWRGAIKVAYLCYQHNPAYACTNTMITRQHIENELAGQIKKNLDGCIDLNQFREKQGIEIDEGNRDVRVILGKTTLVVELYYPLVLRIKNKEEKIDTFQSTIKLPLGILYDIANYITDTETQQKEFNITEWYMRHPDLITVEREIAGNDYIFQLVKDEFLFNFALQKPDFQPAQYGCCYNRYDGMCFKNVQKEQCDDIGGEYDPSPLCLCPAEGGLSCIISLPDAGCPADYTNVLKLTGFENAHVSMPNADAAGQGIFKHSLCCNILAFYITQHPDAVGDSCGAVFAKLSSEQNAHIDDPGDANSHFLNTACISAQSSSITCVGREGTCLGDEEPLISLTDPFNAHAGQPYKYNRKICCKTEQ